MSSQWAPSIMVIGWSILSLRRTRRATDENWLRTLSARQISDERDRLTHELTILVPVGMVVVGAVLVVTGDLAGLVWLPAAAVIALLARRENRLVDQALVVLGDRGLRRPTARQLRWGRWARRAWLLVVLALAALFLGPQAGASLRLLVLVATVVAVAAFGAWVNRWSDSSVVPPASSTS